MRIVFDLDGTLIDSAPDIHAAANRVLEAEGLPPVSFAASRDFVGNGAKVFVERLERAAGGANLPERTARMRVLFAEEYLRAHHLTTVYPGVPEALDRLRGAGWRLGLCTNKPMGPTRAVLAHLGWTEAFEVVIAGDSLPVNKPDPAPLFAALSPLGDGPALFVGDSEVDAGTAQAAGIAFALYAQGYRKTPVGAIPHSAAFDDWSRLPALAREIAR
ncbi:MAG: phosphoglycolate phosphatase [Rhodobacteraceae bacterium]|nr:phosphoglycolate phosphatase [Paracoccaceae bacterium]